MAVDDQPRLGCGRLIDEVWDHIDQPPTAHEATCSFCSDARAGLGRLSVATAELKSSDAANAELQIGSAVKAAIMRIARAEVRRARRLPLEQPPADQIAAALTVSEQAVAAVVRGAADAVAGVRARRCTIDIDKTVMPASTQPLPAAVQVDLRIAVASTTVIPVAVTEIRRRIDEAMARWVGVIVTGTRIEVEDIYDV